MMGHHARSEALFYYFRLEDRVPQTHLLRLIDKHINFEFVREQLKDGYSETGRPSIDPQLLLRVLLIGYLYGISSERKLVEELRMHLARRWFTGLSFDQEVPHHSTFSKNRHGWFQKRSETSNVQLFIVLEDLAEFANEPFLERGRFRVGRLVTFCLLAVLRVERGCSSSYHKIPPIRWSAEKRVITVGSL